MTRVLKVKTFYGGFVVETQHEVISFVGFEAYEAAQKALDACLDSLDKIRCSKCGVEFED